MECFLCLKKLNKDNVSPGVGVVIHRKVFKSEISTELAKGTIKGPGGALCGNEIKHPTIYMEEIPVCKECREEADNRNETLGVHINHILDFGDDHFN